MKDFAKNVQKCLSIYLYRGRHALESLNKDDLEEVDFILRQRLAAYYNFKVADKIACDNGYDIGKDVNMENNINEIFLINKTLEERIANKLSFLKNEIINTSDSRFKISKFRSAPLSERSSTIRQSI